jgi:hypothetical protein
MRRSSQDLKMLSPTAFGMHRVVERGKKDMHAVMGVVVPESAKSEKSSPYARRGTKLYGGASNRPSI